MNRKTMLRVFFFIVCTSLNTLPLHAQEKPRIAVLPFSALEVSAAEARVVTSLFETALVKTEVYNVLEQNQIREILDAQAYSLSGCTDDACAVEVGELLSAELIVLGEFSQVGSRYIANAKIIDVELGRNENADSVSSDSIAEMTDKQIGLLAYKLAGLTYTGGGTEVKIVENFSEVFINSNPDGADVYINGRLRGVSPVLIEKVPQGSVVVTASKGNMYGEIQKAISGSDLVEIYVELKVTYGRMFIKSSKEDVNVLIDGENRGPLKKDLYKDIPAGKHLLTLKGQGLFWEEEILIEKEKTLTVEAYPREMAVFSYDLPDGAEGRIKNSTYEEILSGTGELDIPAGTYSLRIKQADHDPIEEEITLARAETVKYAPKMELSEDYLASQEHEQFKADLARIMEWKEANPDASRTLFDRFYGLYKKLADTEYNHPELKADVKTEVLAAGRARIDELDALIAGSAAGPDTLQQVIFWTSVGVGTVGMVLGLVGTINGYFNYEHYLNNVESPEEALQYHDLLELCKWLQIGGYSASVLAAGGIILTADTGLFVGGWNAEKEDIAGKLARL